MCVCFERETISPLSLRGLSVSPWVHPETKSIQKQKRTIPIYPGTSLASQQNTAYGSTIVLSMYTARHGFMHSERNCHVE